MNARLKIRTLLIVQLFLGISMLQAQGHWYVMLADKDSSQFCSAEQFDQKAIDRRVKYEIPWHSSDWPLNPDYVSQINQLVDSVRFELKWFNAVSVSATLDQVKKLKKLVFVESIVPFGQAKLRLSGTEEVLKDTTKGNRLLRNQRDLLGLGALESNGLNGDGVRIAVFDAGFKMADEHQAFEHLRENNRVVATRNFYRKGKTVYGHSGHGTAVLGCIGGRYRGKWIGAAPNAEFLLARTEHRNREKIIEEDCWLAAMEWADENGADLISSSLGYNTPRYTYENMDGQFTKVSQAARMATRKGILVINSAGNEGASKFKFINSPGDVDSVLTIGAVFPGIRIKMPFSSYGPNSAGHPKPDVSAPGYVVSAAGGGGYNIHAGTSFACPLITGFAACLLQQNPSLKPMDLARKLRALGHLYPFYDYAHGTGVPNAETLFEAPAVLNAETPQFRLSTKGDSLLVTFLDAIWTEDSTITRKPFYFHVEAEPGKLLAYTFDIIEPSKKYLVFQGNWPDGAILRIWFEGYLFEKVLPLE